MNASTNNAKRNIPDQPGSSADGPGKPAGGAVKSRLGGVWGTIRRCADFCSEKKRWAWGFALGLFGFAFTLFELERNLQFTKTQLLALTYERIDAAHAADEPYGNHGQVKMLEQLHAKGQSVRKFDVRGLSLECVRLPNVNWQYVQLQETFLDGAKLPKANLSEAVISDASFYKANLGGANLKKVIGLYAKLDHADLSQADLTGAQLERAKLLNTNLSGAHLDRADLADANLSEAFLVGATMVDTNLRKANLSDANLTGVDLSKSRGLTKTQVMQACGSDVVFPERIGKMNLKPCKKKGWDKPLPANSCQLDTN